MSHKRNVRWGPCPHCGAEGWDAIGQRQSNLLNHDRPQGGRCLKATEDYKRGAGYYPSGARVYVDGRDEAIVRQAFPEGSTSHLFAHYKVDLVGGDRNVAVAMSRVSGMPYGSNAHTGDRKVPS